MSASITTNGMTARLHREGRRFPGNWAMTARGEPTDDPGVLFAEPRGTLLPTGGREYGHKGYNLALTVEALSQGLAGHGRADRPTGWGASVYLQVLDPAAFGGAGRFVRQTGFIAAACRSNPAAAGARPCVCLVSRVSHAGARPMRPASSSIPGSWMRWRPGPSGSRSSRPRPRTD